MKKIVARIMTLTMLYLMVGCGSETPNAYVAEVPTTSVTAVTNSSKPTSTVTTMATEAKVSTKSVPPASATTAPAVTSAPATKSTQAVTTTAPLTTTAAIANASPVPEAINTRGNTNGNLANEGYFAQQGSWIYYTDFSDNRGLFKIRADGTGKTKLNDEQYAKHINVVGDWIYYHLNFSAGIYKIRTDGSQKTKLVDYSISKLIVIDNWIYYRKDGSSYEYGDLYKIRTDGTEETMLDDNCGYEIDVLGDWIYFTSNISDEKLYKIRIDGSEKALLCDDVCACVQGADDWIYYKNASDNFRIYKIRTDGSGKTKMSDARSRIVNSGINVVGGWIYYLNSEIFDDYGTADEVLYKVRIDGTETTRLSCYQDTHIHVLNDWMYFQDFITFKANHATDLWIRGTCKMRTDGTQPQLMAK